MPFTYGTWYNPNYRHILVFSGDKNSAMFVDASHGTHLDFKSHTGCFLSFCGSMIYVKSTKQKINTKSSTESELVGLSDSASVVLWFRYFLIYQGYNIKNIDIFQDNMSTIKMIKNGYSNNEKSRHINIRYYFLTDRIKNGEINVKYISTENMLADILTKPLQGQLFTKLRNKIHNI